MLTWRTQVGEGYYILSVRAVHVLAAKAEGLRWPSAWLALAAALR